MKSKIFFGSLLMLCMLVSMSSFTPSQKNITTAKHVQTDIQADYTDPFTGYRIHFDYHDASNCDVTLYNGTTVLPCFFSGEVNLSGGLLYPDITVTYSGGTITPPNNVGLTTY